MSWETLGTVLPGEEWQYIDTPLSSRLISISYVGDETWLRKFQPRLYLRLWFSTGATAARWITLWPKSGEEEILLIDPIPIAPNYLNFRKRRNFESLSANYSITVREYRAAPYLISYL
ncbi:MAG: hypothetical protein AAGB19_09475 [Cyanobacteria bacterium P01_F01_bin.3]